MLFEERELTSFAEPVAKSELIEGSIYFFVEFVDDKMLIPTMQTVVYIGMDLGVGDAGVVYFQDADSFLGGVRYNARGSDDHLASNDAQFYLGSEDELGHVFDYERALDVLLRCSIRRRRMLKE